MNFGHLILAYFSIFSTNYHQVVVGLPPPKGEFEQNTVVVMKHFKNFIYE